LVVSFANDGTQTIESRPAQSPAQCPSQVEEVLSVPGQIQTTEEELAKSSAELQLLKQERRAAMETATLAKHLKDSVMKLFTDQGLRIGISPADLYAELVTAVRDDQWLPAKQKLNGGEKITTATLEFSLPGHRDAPQTFALSIHHPSPFRDSITEQTFGSIA